MIHAPREVVAFFRRVAKKVRLSRGEKRLLAQVAAWRALKGPKGPTFKGRHREEAGRE